MDKARVPVVLVEIVGCTEDFLDRALHGQRPLIEMRIGRPLVLTSSEILEISRHKARQQNTDAVMTHIAALLPPDYRGVY